MRKLGFSPRPAARADLEQVAAIETASIRPHWSLASFSGELEKPHSHFWVVSDDETDEKIAAYAVFHFPAEQAHLVTFAVHPDFRRQGLALYFLRQILGFVMRNKGDSVILEVRKGNRPAVELYQKVGFVVIRTLSRFYPDGEDAYVMIFMTERSKLTGDPDVDFETDLPSDGKQNLN